MMYNIQHDEYEANNIIKSTESIISDTLVRSYVDRSTILNIAILYIKLVI